LPSTFPLLGPEFPPRGRRCIFMWGNSSPSAASFPWISNRPPSDLKSPTFFQPWPVPLFFLTVLVPQPHFFSYRPCLAGGIHFLHCKWVGSLVRNFPFLPAVRFLSCCRPPHNLLSGNVPPGFPTPFPSSLPAAFNSHLYQGVLNSIENSFF